MYSSEHAILEGGVKIVACAVKSMSYIVAILYENGWLYFWYAVLYIFSTHIGAEYLAHHYR